MGCRLYLVSPPVIDHPSIFAADFRAALDGGDVAAFLLSLAGGDEAAITRVADTLRPVCQQRDVGFFLNGRPDLAVKLDCDGLEIGPADYGAARRLLGSDRQIGVRCPSSRHVAMEAAEAGADYVAFERTELELIEWWSGLFEIPCVATGDITFAAVKPLLAAGADFLAVGDGVWKHGDGPEAAVRAFNAALGSSADGQP
jgi:thiamine-phosphate pyrophosphorylase